MTEVDPGFPGEGDRHMGIGHEIDRVRVGVVTTSSPTVLASTAGVVLFSRSTA